MGEDDVRVDEFDRMAEWTVDAIEAVAPADPVPGACNGSGSPSFLEWLAAALMVGPTHRVLDTGGGLGGPAAWMAARTGARLHVSEPMRGAARGSRRLFRLPAVVAWSHQLPFRDGSFDAALAMAVLSTVEDKSLYLGEVARVLPPGGGLALLDYVRTVGELPDPPANNSFLTPTELDEQIEACGFDIVDSAMGADLPSAPQAWKAAADRVADAVASAHTGESALDRAVEQQGRFARLLAEDRLVIRLVAARRR
jgi:SAM-dependent methyltransferase